MTSASDPRLVSGSDTDDGEPGLLALLAEDFATHDHSLLEAGFWAVTVHRLRQRARRIRVPVLGSRLRQAAEVLSAVTDWGLGIRIDPKTQLGRRVRIWHHGCVRIQARAVGDDVHLRPNTTSGPARGGGDDPADWPLIGAGVDVGAGACILGAVQVGAGAFVGANALVTKNVPARTLVMGVPARPLPVSPRAEAPAAGTARASRPVTGRSNQNPRDIGFLALLGEDFHTHGADWTAPGFWAVAWHRFGNLRMSIRQKPLRAPLSLVYRAGFHAVRLGFGIDLPYDVKLGRRVRIEHHGSVTIGARSVGNDVIVRGSVVTGVLRRGCEGEKPVIEDRVELGPRACVVGGVTVGHDTLVLANTVVPVNVPPGSTVLGVPARIVQLEKLLSAEVGSSEPAPPADAQAVAL